MNSYLIESNYDLMEGSHQVGEGKFISIEN